MNNDNETLVAERWIAPEHECPYCGHVQFDLWGEREWQCEECKQIYDLPALDNPNDR